jgi:hypothetical protein
MLDKNKIVSRFISFVYQFPENSGLKRAAQGISSVIRFYYNVCSKTLLTRRAIE